jgi:hypothetical protein
MDDFTLHRSGTLYLLTPNTQDAKDWVKLHIPEDAQYLGKSLAIEGLSYLVPILQGIDDDGLTVDRHDHARPGAAKPRDA